MVLFSPITYAQSCLSGTAISISNLFPEIYGDLYHFNPSKQGLLYLPMLAGSLLAGCGIGRAGDKCVIADLSGPLGVLIGKRNADYAANKKTIDAETPTSVTTVYGPEDDARGDRTKVPEMRLVIALVGVLICIVGGFPSYRPVDTYSPASFRSAFCGLASELKTTSTGQTLPSRVVSRRTVPKW